MSTAESMLSPALSQSVRSKETAALRCVIAVESATLASLSGEWEHLWQADPKRDIFQKPPWALAWLSAFGKEKDVFAPLVYRGAALIGVLPLVRDGRQLRF